MTPADHGYGICLRCGRWRRPGTLKDAACIEGCGGQEPLFVAHAGSPVLFTDGVDVNATSKPTGLDANGDAL